MPQIRDKWRWFAVALTTLAVAGCAASSRLGTWNGPEMMSAVSVSDAPKLGADVKIIHTPHYEIYSTITDRPDLLDNLAQLMEGANAMYRQMAPGLPDTSQPLQCYLFATRPQFDHFTADHAGIDASVYLKIARGGYTIHDWYVAYYIGDQATYSVAAHEGWHQYVNRHFRGRLPPFLEEGIACMFENVEWSDNLPRWNLSINSTRALSLRRAMDAGQTFPLDKLITLHAGEVVNMSALHIEAFYAEDWAFARYLWEGENGKYRPALQRLLADTAAGNVYDPTGSHRRSYLPWNPAGIRPMLEHYLGADIHTIDSGFQRFMTKIAYDEIRDQFQM